MALNFAPFAGAQGIRDAYRNRPPLKLGARGAAVRVLQGALIDYGLELPVTTGKYGRPDGIFGEETQAAVLAFQAGNGINADGIAGQKTIQALDHFLCGLSSKLSQPAAFKKSLPLQRHASGARYTLGFHDPVIVRDPGAGVWNSTPKTATCLAMRATLEVGLWHLHGLFGRDAVFHLLHYLHCSGANYTIDLEGMIASVPSAMTRFELEAAYAQTFVESLDVGTYDITATETRGAENPMHENRNWFLATGRYVSWGKGRADVTEGMFGREFTLDFEYKFHDRYNWDTGKGVEIHGVWISDRMMGEFHRQGVAREFDCVGSVRRRLTWRKLQPVSRPQLVAPAGRIR